MRLLKLSEMVNTLPLVNSMAPPVSWMSVVAPVELRPIAVLLKVVVPRSAVYEPLRAVKVLPPLTETPFNAPEPLFSMAPPAEELEVPPTIDPVPPPPKLTREPLPVACTSPPELVIVVEAAAGQVDEAASRRLDGAGVGETAAEVEGGAVGGFDGAGVGGSVARIELKGCGLVSVDRAGIAESERVAAWLRPICPAP